MTAVRQPREPASEALLVLLRRVCSVFGPKRLAMACKPGKALLGGLVQCDVHLTIYLLLEDSRCVCTHPQMLGLVDLAAHTGLAISTFQEALAGHSLHPKTLGRIEAGCRKILTGGSGLQLIQGGKS